MPLINSPVRRTGVADESDLPGDSAEPDHQANQNHLGLPGTQLNQAHEPPANNVTANNYTVGGQQNQVFAVSKPQVPDFYQDDPKTWFLVVEAEFKSFPTCSDNTKFSTVIKALDPSTLKQINDILSHPPDRSKYEAVKTAILERLASSRQKEIRRLLRGMTLGNRKPSQLLREMKDIAGASVDSEFLHQLWLDSLPADIRTLLVINDNANLDTLAKVADRSMEARGMFVMSTSASVDRIDPPNRAFKDLEKKIDETQQMLATCCRELKSLKEQQGLMSQQLQQTTRTTLPQFPQYQQQQFAQSPQQFRSRSRSRSRRHDEQGICYYHQRFGTSAKFCTTPCTYEKNAKPQGN